MQRRLVRLAKTIAGAASVLVLGFLLFRGVGYVLPKAGISLQGIGFFIQKFLPHPALYEELEKTKTQRDTYAAQLVEYHNVLEENTALKASTKFTPQVARPLILSSIIDRDLSSDHCRLLLDRGEDDGIKTGYPVVSPDGVLMGTVIGTTSWTSTVRCLLDRESKIAVTLLNESRTLGFVQGYDASFLQWKYLPPEAKVQVNNMVVTSGLQPFIPPGLRVGIVNTFRTEQTTPFEEAIVEPFGDSARLLYASVILPPVKQ